jgi:hypothetical protein
MNVAAHTVLADAGSSSSRCSGMIATSASLFGRSWPVTREPNR